MPEDLLHMNQSDFEEMSLDEKIMWVSQHYEVPETLSTEEAYQKLTKKLEQQESKKTIQIKRWSYIILSAAAIIILLLGLLFLWPDKSVNTVVVQKGQHSDIKLPDGSKILLNADTKISYRKSKFQKKRRVEFEGEAFFNIEKGNKFTIKTDKAEIQILGTSFNIFARENQFKVSCFTGKILVKSAVDSVIIGPDQTAYLDKNQLRSKKEDNINTTAKWRVGEFYYENTQLNSVFDEIERQFNVNFVLPKLDDRKFTGSFSNKNLVNTLDIVCIPMGLTYEIGTNSTIYIQIKSH